MTTYSIGAAGKANALSALYDVDFEPIVPLLVGEEGKLSKFLMELGGTEDLMATHADWAYSEARDCRDTVSGAHTSSTKTFTVTNINLWAPNDIVLDPATGETMVIESVNTGTSQFVVNARARGTNAASSLADQAEIVNLGPAYPDGASITQARMVVDTLAQNNVQLFWENVEFDGTQLAINAKKGLMGGDYETRKRKEKLLEVLRKIDYAHMFGESTDDGTWRTMGGIYNFVASTETATIATLTETTWEQHLETKGLLHGAESKVALTSSFVSGGMNRWSTAKFAINNVGGTEYGYKLYRYMTPQGELRVMPHYNLSVSSTLKGRIIIFDTTNIHRAVLRPLKLYVDIETGTKDTRMDAWLGQMTCRWGHPRHHSIIKGINAVS